MKQVEEGILSRRKCELIVFRTEDGDNFDEVLALARHKGIRCEGVKNREFEKLSNTVHAQGILGYFRMVEREILDDFNAVDLSTGWIVGKRNRRKNRRLVWLSSDSALAGL